MIYLCAVSHSAAKYAYQLAQCLLIRPKRLAPRTGGIFHEHSTRIGLNYDSLIAFHTRALCQGRNRTTLSIVKSPHQTQRADVAAAAALRYEVIKMPETGFGAHAGNRVALARTNIAPPAVRSVVGEWGA